MKHQLYDTLRSGLDPNKAINLQGLCMAVNSIQDREVLSTIYSLIYHHSIMEGQQNPEPYGSNFNRGSKFITFQVAQLPIDLVRIIDAYVFAAKA